MTSEELRLEILDDPGLKARAIAGDDGGISRAMTRESTATSLTIVGLLDALSSETAAKLAVNSNTTDLRDKLLAGDIVGVGLWVGLFAKAGILTAEEYQTIQLALVAALPNGRVVTVEQVNKALRPHRPDGKAGSKHWSKEPINGVA